MLDHIDAADTIRTVLLTWGTALALVSFKFAYIAIRNGESFRAFGLASYAFMVLTPVVVGLHRYEQPVIIVSAVTYLAGLLCGTLALRAVLTITPEWARLFAADRHRRKRAKHRDQ